MIRKANVSKTLRDAKFFTTGANSLYRESASELRDVLLDEFRTMVYETPQYTGSTAASWRIGFLQFMDTAYTEIKLGESPLAKGHSTACEMAMVKAEQTLTDDFSMYFGGKGKGFGQDIVIENEAPGFDTAEEGPVRSVNTPPGALKRFIARLATREIGK